ncbi:hypothetical protein RRG08_042108 [Elysia crispata]|uniref:UspA domain-containing protein n=1 Tax=Elysia crispata TaxID=231223 RepID=A0AAE1D858_9GAST|nr:hypothetical protein RRG08_042108 [Elysia crispata]
MTRTVVLGVDDSEFSEYAFDFYTKHLYVKGDEIVLVHVSEYSSLVQAPALLTDPFVVSELIKEEQAKVKILVDKYSKKMKSLQLGGRVKQMAGKSGEAIIAAAKEEGAGLIVMGSRGMVFEQAMLKQKFEGPLQRILPKTFLFYLIHFTQN